MPGQRAIGSGELAAVRAGIGGPALQVIVTVTLGRAAPFWSVTTPERLPPVWAEAGYASRAMKDCARATPTATNRIRAAKIIVRGLTGSPSVCNYADPVRVRTTAMG